MNRRLYRCTHDRRLAGVAGGLAEYLDVDPTLIRILFVVSIFFGGLGLLLYIIMAIVVPLEPAWYPGPGYAGPGYPGPGYGAPAAGGWSTPEGSGGAPPGDPEAGTGTGGPDAAAGYSGTSAGPGWHAVSQPHQHATRGGSGTVVTFFGIVFILFGALALVDALLPSWADQGRFLWPAFVLGVGVLLVATAIRRGQERS